MGAGGEERLLGIIDDSQCTAIIAPKAYCEQLKTISNTIPIATFEQLEADADTNISPPAQTNADDLAFIQYTSGSVATPKGVLVTYGNLNANMRMMAEGRYDCSRIFLSWVPHYHDMGLIGNFYLAMYDGGELHLTGADTFVRRPLSWLRLLSRTRATGTTVPHFALTLCTQLAHTLKPGEIDLSNLRMIVNSSEPVDWDGLAEFEAAFAPFGLSSGTVVPHYGLAECTVMVSYPGPDRPRYLDVDRAQLANGIIIPCSDTDKSQRIVSCGRGQIDSEFAIVDPETLEDCGPDRTGEVWITGSHVAQGFWNRPEETAHAFGRQIKGDTSDKLYVRSGDLGFVHDGDLFITGRMKDVIIIRGQNYFARDIEILAEQASPLIRTGRVVAIPMKHKGEETVGLLAEIAAKFDYRKDALDFVARFNASLGERLGLSPQVIVLVRRNSLPRTTSGKIRRRDAAELYRKGELTTVFEYHSSRFTPAGINKAAFPGLKDSDALRRWLEVLILEQSGVDKLSPDEDLFELGVDSLSMTNLLLEVEDLTGQSLLDEQFYAAPTLNTLIDTLSRNAPSPKAAPASANSPVDEAPAKRGWKKSLALQLRSFGPIWKSFKLPYRFGSHLLDRFTASQSITDRLARPYADALDALIEEQNIQDPERIRREVVRTGSWFVWRESSLGNAQTFADNVRYEGLHHIEQARQDGKSIIVSFVTTRLKGLYKYIPQLTDRPFGVIANLSADRIAFYGMGELAHVTGGKVSHDVSSARVAQIHNAHRILGKGGTIGVFIDSFQGVGGIKVPFFGRKRPMRPGVAELALDTNSAIIPVQQWLHDDGQITFEFKEPLTAQGETREEQVLSLMIQQTAILEEMWRTNPGQLSDEAIKRQLELPKL